MAKPIKVQITPRALLQRINRKLAKEDEKVCKSRPFYDGDRGPYYDNELGEFYCIDMDRNVVKTTHVKLDVLGRELGVLANWETLADD